MKDSGIHPPRWATRLLSWYCRDDLLEDLQGDLNEFFARNVETKGVARAKVIYVLDVLKFFRLYTVRRPEIINLLIHWIMIGNYIKTSRRLIFRNKLFSSLNIVGLAISMSTGLLMVALLSDLFSYDRFHEKGDRIYRVITTRQHGGGSPREYASTSFIAGKKIQETIPGIETLTTLEGSFHEDAYRDNSVVPLQGLWADGSFFNVFSFALLKGNRATALKEPYSLVLTETGAHKLFPGEEAYGRSVRLKDTDYLVTGIVKDLPPFSHIRFEALASLSTKEILEKDNPEWFTWTHISSNYVYLLLSENSDLLSLQRSLDELCGEENINPDVPTISLSLQPLHNIALGKGLGNSLGPSIPIEVMWVLGGLALVVILCACFNYTSLSLARALKRSREITMRKIAGAGRIHVFGQLIVEAVLVSLLALVVSFLLFLLLRTHFLSLDPMLNRMVTLQLSPEMVLYFIVFALLIGVLAGFLPALFFSKMKSVQNLKGISYSKSFRHLKLRKSLIVVQYTFSLLFISVTILGYRQYRNFVTFDMGFQTGNVLNIELQGNKADQLIKELKEMSEVSDVSRSAFISSLDSYAKTSLKYGTDSITVHYNTIDENYLRLHAFNFLAGGNFPGESASRDKVIVNQEFLRYFHISPDNPVRSLGEVVKLNGKDHAIAGVVKDFYYGGAGRLIEPFVFSYSVEEAQFVSVKVVSNDPVSFMSRIERAWHKIDPVHPVKAAFYDDAIQDSYSDIFAMLKIIGFLSFLTISIASVGMFGMVVFTTETRLREISIRKVFGSSESDLVYILSRGVLLLLAVAALIALPATYLLFDRIILPNIAYHAPVRINDLLSGTMAVTGIALLMIGSQTLKAARRNPAEVLRNE